MGEVKCPSCWNEMPDEAVLCPKCGFMMKYFEQRKGLPLTITDNSHLSIVDHSFASSELEQDRKRKKHKTTIVIAVVLVTAIIAVGVMAYINRQERKEDTRIRSTEGYSYYTSNHATTGNEGALNKARSYLKSSAFSYTGLVKQLEFEGFSNSEALYGVNNCGADWREQALKKQNST